MNTIKKTIQYALKHRLFYLLLCSIFLIRIIELVSVYYMDTDTYFILAEGRSIISEGIPYSNNFTVVEGLSVVIQQWLWDVVVYGCYAFLGNAGLFGLTFLTVVLTGLLIYKYTGYSRMDKWLRIIITVTALYFFSQYFSTRPNLITFDILFMELILLEEYKKTGNDWCVAFLPMLTLVMMNLHGSMWVMMFAFVLPFVFPVFKTFVANMPKRNYDIKPILAVVPFMLAALIFNPYGFDGIMYLFRSMGGKLDSIGIAELQNVAITSLYGGLIFIIAVLYGVIYIGQHKQIEADRAYLFWGTMILGTMYYRTTAYAVIAAIVLLTDILQDTDYEKFHNFANDQIKPVILIACIGVGAVIWDWYKTGIYAESDMEGSPVEAVKYLDTNAGKGTAVYTAFNSGAYMEWKGYKVYIDARPELYFKKVNKKEDIIDEFLMVERDLTNETYEAFKGKYGFEYYLASDGSLIGAYLEKDNDFKEVVNGEGYKLYELRKGDGSNGTK